MNSPSLTPPVTMTEMPMRFVRRPDARKPWGTPITKWAMHRKKSFELMARADGKQDYVPGMDAKVPCNGCNACCRSGLDIDLENWEPAQEFDVEPGTRRLRKNADGSCVHLVAGRCSVYEKRPAACRTYDCRDLAMAQGNHPQTATAQPVNDVIMSWVPECKTKEDEDVLMILATTTAAIMHSRRGVLPTTALAYALRDYKKFLPEADGIRAMILRNPFAKKMHDMMCDPATTPEMLEAALGAGASV